MEKMILIPYQEYLELIKNNKPVFRDSYDLQDYGSLKGTNVTGSIIPSINTNQTLFTVKQFIEKHPHVTNGGLRLLIFNEKANGFRKAIKRIGRKVLIDEKAYFEWIENQNSNK